jgi:short subunit dehydrogenase-like uncharacterized protein
MNRRVLVYGAYGHTGRFVVAQLLARGMSPVLSGRDRAKLEALQEQFPALEVRAAAVDDEVSLHQAAEGVGVVVNCAGPFLDTAVPLATAAVSAGAHYLDITAEQAAVQAVYAAHEERGWPTSVAVIPAMAFYGGLADLAATAAASGWDAVDEVTVTIGLDRWWPTAGTRSTGRRNTATRLVVEGGHLVAAPSPPPERVWQFRGPLGHQTVVACPFAEIITIARHLRSSKITTYITTAALDDIANPATPPPEPAGTDGRSAQQFVLDVVVTRSGHQRRISVSGQDIYFVTAPLVAEAARRLIQGDATIRGAAAPAEVFDADNFLEALCADQVDVRRTEDA